MSFEYSCFISYRGYREDEYQDELWRTFIEDLDMALSNEIRVLLNEGIYRDKNRLQTGDLFNEDLARAICKSVCMLLVFTPRYFDNSATYCAREYKAMERLEQERLTLLKDPNDRTHGLIIPIVFRGGKYLPDELRSRRQCAFFDTWTLSNERIIRHPQYAPKITEIADYILRRCLAFRDVPEAFASCEEFTLPTEEDIQPWLANVAGYTPRFVNR